jgi:hypothetical protein
MLQNRSTFFKLSIFSVILIPIIAFNDCISLKMIPFNSIEIGLFVESYSIGWLP